jgi:phosphonopyruvate decarboxylase
MIKAKKLIEEFKKLDINFFCGVPDSLMSEFSKSLHFDFNNENHIISTNEGSALAACMGYNVATGNVPLIYMQNSGLGNFINPYTSLLHEKIYKIPFLLLIGWRGEPGTIDEPQHQFQGEITIDLLKLLEIEFLVIDANSNLDEILLNISLSIEKKTPLALVVKKGTFKKDLRSFEKFEYLPKRKDALSKVVSKFTEQTLYIATTGKLSRELFELRKKLQQPNDDLYVVGGMGHASAISMGILHKVKNKRVVCLDGDGSILMHMGNLGILGNSGMENFVHIIFNNSAHESVGGQPTIYNLLDSKSLFQSLGYKNVILVKQLADLDDLEISNLSGPSVIEIRVQNSSDLELMRPDRTPLENKNTFIEKINE